MMKRTKIICTLGPAVDSESALKNLVLAGMDVARCNFSHGSRAEHKARMDRLKKVRRELDAPCALMLDTKGPSIRTGKLEGNEPVLLRAGDNFFLTEDGIAGTSRRVHQTFKGLYKYVEPGTIILIDDGLIELAVDRILGSDIQCTVQNSGMLGECKQLNLPGTNVPLPVMTKQDKEDLLFGIQQGVDFVAASFVSCGEDVRAIRAFLAENGGESIRIVAKIENAHAVDHIEEIIEVSDAVMVARGDLGVEVPSNQVPHLQKKIIKACNRAYRPVITATQMLDSMIRNPRPTRAEVADVANAIYDGTDAVTPFRRNCHRYVSSSRSTNHGTHCRGKRIAYLRRRLHPQPQRRAEEHFRCCGLGCRNRRRKRGRLLHRYPYDDRPHGPHRFQLPSEDAHLCGNHFGRIPSFLAAELGRYAAFRQSCW